MGVYEISYRENIERDKEDEHNVLDQPVIAEETN